MAPGTRWILTSVLGFLMVREATPAACGSWWGPKQRKCYTLNTKYLSWNEANSHGCSDLYPGAHLAAITLENAAFLSKLDIKANYYWVGLRSGQTQWNLGTSAAVPVDHTNYDKIRARQPSGAWETNTDCVLMTGNFAPAQYLPAGGWMNWDCDVKLPSLCELRPAPPSGCPSDYRAFDGACFIFISAKKTFAQAEEHCASLQPGGHLAEVTDFAGLNDVLTLNEPVFWIGATSTPDANGILRWKNGAVISNPNWKHVSYDEPNGSSQHDGNCVYVNGRKPGLWFTPNAWNDADCNVPKLRSLCAVPLPGSTTDDDAESMDDGAESMDDGAESMNGGAESMNGGANAGGGSGGGSSSNGN